MKLLSRTVAVLFLLVVGAILVLVVLSRMPAHTTFVSTPVWPTSTPTVFPTPVPPKPGEQRYVDPDKLYSVNLPAAWHPTGRPGSFAGKDGFLEIGYLPSLGYMPTSFGVCEWIANVATQHVYTIAGIPRIMHDSCELFTLPGVAPDTWMGIRANFDADYKHRFLYLQTDAKHYPTIDGSFSWLKPVKDQADSNEIVRATDRDFWNHLGDMPKTVSVKEYKLLGDGQHCKTHQDICASYIPSKTLREQSDGLRSEGLDKTWQAINKEIEPFGYKLQPEVAPKVFRLYRGNTLLFDNVYEVPQIHFLPSKGRKEISMLVGVARDPQKPFYDLGNVTRFLVTDGSVTQWKCTPDEMKSFSRDAKLHCLWSPILYKDELIGLKTNGEGMIQVQDQRENVLAVFAIPYLPDLGEAVFRFQSWGSHWEMETYDFVVRDGRILNKELGFEAVFGLTLLDDKPFYFFRKGPRVGISYNGHVLPVYYEEIPHYMGCDLWRNNPRRISDSVRFFAKRAGTWYYVVVQPRHAGSHLTQQ